MRVVADTNVLVSGLLWHGPSRRVLDLLQSRAIELYTSPGLLVELEDVLTRPKFTTRLLAAGVTPSELIVRLVKVVGIVRPAFLEPVIHADPDDDQVLACALSAGARFIVSGDRHLLELAEFRGIPIVTAVQFLARVGR